MRVDAALGPGYDRDIARGDAVHVVYGVGDVFGVYLGIAEKLDRDVELYGVGIRYACEERDEVAVEGLVAGYVCGGNELEYTIRAFAPHNTREQAYDDCRFLAICECCWDVNDLPQLCLG